MIKTQLFQKWIYTISNCEIF